MKSRYEQMVHVFCFAFATAVLLFVLFWSPSDVFALFSTFSVKIRCLSVLSLLLSLSVNLSLLVFLLVDWFLVLMLTVILVLFLFLAHSWSISQKHSRIHMKNKHMPAYHSVKQVNKWWKCRSWRGVCMYALFVYIIYVHIHTYMHIHHALTHTPSSTHADAQTHVKNNPSIKLQKTCCLGVNVAAYHKMHTCWSNNNEYKHFSEWDCQAQSHLIEICTGES